MGSGPHAEVEIFAMQEVALVHEADVVNGSAFDEHAGTRDGLDGDGLRREWLKVQMEIVEEVWPLARQPREAEGSHERPPWRGDGATAAPLLDTIGIREEAACHRGLRMALDGRAQSRESPRANHAVGVQEHDERLGREFGPQIAACGEAAILCRADHMQMRMRLKPCDQGLESIRVRRVIDEHHLAGLSQRRFEAFDQKVADVMVDDHDRDRCEPRDLREPDG